MTKSTENIEKKIEAQLEKLKQLKAQKQAIEAREKTKQKEQERKDDTRRKILLGSYLIKKMNANEANKEKILTELNEYLTEDRDRKLFDLPLNEPLQELVESVPKKMSQWENEYEKYLKDCDDKKNQATEYPSVSYSDEDDLELDGYPSNFDRSLVNKH